VPMDIEWARDGVDGLLYIVQARPETVESQHLGGILERFELQQTGMVLAEGRAVGTRVASGCVRVISDSSDLKDFQVGEVLVSDTTAPDWEPVMKQAAAIVTNRGGRTCHAAIVARELGIPAIVGCGDATRRLGAAEAVTVACCDGEAGRVYAGILPFDVIRTDVTAIALKS